MPDPRQLATELLTSVGARLKRHRKHEVWELPNGRNWVRSKTPSDAHSDHNNLADLRKELGIRPEPKPIPSTKRTEKKGTAGDGKRQPLQPIDSPLANALRVSGVVEQQLREQITDLESRYAQLTIAHAHLWAQVERCWLCRFRKWLRGKLVKLVPEKQ